MTAAIAYVSVLIAFAAIDSVWLATMGAKLYQPEIGELLADKFRPAPAVVFYLLYCAGLTIFAVLPGVRENWKAAALWGGLFGFFCYATYDLTNYAVMKTWSLKVTVLDMAWGAFVSAAAATVAAAVTVRIVRAVS